MRKLPKYNEKFIESRYQEFMSEIDELSKKREYKGATLNLKNSFKTCDYILREKKKSYDSEYIDIFKKYHLNTDSIQKELDSAWEKNGIISKIPMLNGLILLQMIFKKYTKRSVEIARETGTKKIIR